MAISRIGGKALKANLERDSNLAFNTTTLVVDYATGRIGVGTASPTHLLTVSGTAKVTGATTLASTLGFATGVTANKILDEDNMSSNDASALSSQQAIKAYVDAQVSGGGVSTGMQITMGTPTDSSLTTDGAYQGFLTSTKVTDAIDDLNEVTENIRNSTFVKSVTFTSDVTAAGSGFTATLSITATGTANRYVINWGDGTSNTTTASTSPTHVYSNFADSPHSITVTASNTGGSGTGSSAAFTRTDYIICCSRRK